MPLITSWPFCRLLVLDEHVELAIPGGGPLNFARKLAKDDVKVVTFTGYRWPTGIMFAMTDGSEHLFTCFEPQSVHRRLTQAGYRTSPMITRV